MPVLGHTITEDTDSYSYSQTRVDIQPIPNAGELGGAQAYYPIVPDFTTEQTAAGAANATLKDILSGNAWRLTRIVGKISLAPYVVSQGVGRWPNIYVTAGFFVAKVDDTDQSQIAMSGLDFAPNNIDNITSPWIWRRTWMLGNPAAADPTTNPVDVHFREFSTQEFGSVMDGPHIDAKSKRFINREHRLWLVINCAGYSANNLSISPVDAETTGIAGLVDLRILGQLARQRNTSSF